MRIAIFADNFYPEMSGITDTVLTTGKELARRGHQVDFFVPRYVEDNYKIGGVKFAELDLGPNIHIYRSWSLPFAAPTRQGRAGLPNFFRGFFNRTKYDIVHSQSFFGVGLDALAFAKLRGIPLVGTNHTLIDSFVEYSPIKAKWVSSLLTNFLIWYYNRCDYVSTPSAFLLTDMKNKGLKRPGGAVSNPIDEAFYVPRADKATLKQELGLAPFTILYVGRLSAEKNPRSLLGAFISFAQNHPDAELVFVGQGTLRPELERMAAESPVHDRIKFAGPYLGENKQKLYDYFHTSDVFVMPSTSETQSMCTLQAMCAGLPILAARAGALPELVGNDKGLIFEPDNEKEISSLLDRLYNNPEERTSFGNAGRVFVERFHPGLIASKWEEIFTKVIKENG